MTDANGAAGFRFIQRRSQFEQLARGSSASSGSLPSKVVGVAQVLSTLQLEREGRHKAPKDPKNSHVPALSTMATAALNVLAEDPDGFFLMIEGGAVDWANHKNNLERMIEELADFSQTVQAVLDWVEANSGWEETLLIVTADHECGMLWGDSTFVDRNNNGHFDAGIDTFLGWQPIGGKSKGRVPGHQYGSGGHTNALVPLWAMGTGSRHFHALVDGTDRRAAAMWGFSGRFVDNTDVFTVMKAAMGPEPAPTGSRKPTRARPVGGQ
jgi:alkaline phosphatase